MKIFIILQIIDVVFSVRTNFLQNTMKKINHERLGVIPGTISLIDRYEDPTNSPDYIVQEEAVESPIPESITLSKEQLFSLYRAAVNKASKLVPEVQVNHSSESVDGLMHSVAQGKIPGYYYYYYPVQSFLNTNDLQSQEANNNQQNIMNNNKGKTQVIEPLFAAMAGFAGIAMMFIFSILFFPKFGSIKSRNMILKQGSEDFLIFTTLLKESAQGKDCSNRIVCEVGKSIRTMHLGTNSIRLIELILPANLAKQVARIRRSANKKEKCNFIKCKAQTKF